MIQETNLKNSKIISWKEIHIEDIDNHMNVWLNTMAELYPRFKIVSVAGYIEDGKHCRSVIYKID